jgi:hypothetical protein
MASRVRFLSCSPISKKDLRAVSEVLAEREYSDKVVWGFIDVRNEGDAVTATFVERFETEEKIEDPFGDFTTYKRVRFNQTPFRLSLSVPQLELYDGPRSIEPLLTELSGIVGSSLSFASVSVDLQTVMRHFKRDTLSIALVAATLQDISLAPDAFARVAVFGNGEIGPHLKVAAMGKKIAFQKVSLKGSLRTGSFKVDISSDARVQIHNGPVEDLTTLIRASIETSIIAD